MKINYIRSVMFVVISFVGSSQSLQYITGVAIETTYMASEPFEVKAVYGDFMNTNPIWAQLWRESDKPYQFELVWQVKVKPVRGNGTDEWVSRISNDNDKPNLFVLF